MKTAMHYLKHFTLWELFVLAAAWWYRRVCFDLLDFDAVWNIGKRLWPVHAYRVADFITVRLVPFLLLDWLAWLIAEDCIRAQWDIENERLEAARRPS